MTPSSVVTGMGAISALGSTCDAHVEALIESRDGIRRVERFATDGLGSIYAGTWPGWDGRTQPEPGPERDLAACAAAFPIIELALPAAREAWARAELDAAIEQCGYRRHRLALVLGTCFGQGYRDFHEVTEELAAALHVSGPCITISTACASSANAIGLARDLVVNGYADAALAGGVDSLLREAFAGFSALGVLSPEPCAPFSAPMGTTLGEGAGFLVIERSDRAAARRANVWTVIHGYGLSADAFHETSPDPGGLGIGRAIRSALADARWSPASVDYVSAHATGTSNNDRTEWTAIEREIGPHVSVSAPKSMLGHTQGASGALELVLTLLASRKERVPQTLHFRGARPGCPADPAVSAAARSRRTRRGLKLTAAFGGANAVVAYGPPSTSVEETDGVRASTEKRGAPIHVRGVGIIGPAGALRSSREILGAGEAQSGGVRQLDFEAVAKGIEPRRLDRSSKYLIAAAAMCVANAGIALRGPMRDRAGLFVGATRMPEESARRCRDSMRYHGVTGTSAAAFARMSVNAPAGACAKAFALRGPSTTISVGEGSGLLAIVLAAEWLSSRSDTDCIVAGSVDELNPDGADTEGAVCALLARRDADAISSDKENCGIRVAGWGIAGPGDLSTAVSAALGAFVPDMVVSDSDAVRTLFLESPTSRLIDVSSSWGNAEATRSAVAFALADALLREGQGDSALVVSARSRSAASALLLRRGES